MSHSHQCFFSILMLFIPFSSTSMDIEVSSGGYLALVHSRWKKKAWTYFCKTVGDDQQGQYLALYNPLIKVYTCHEI